METVISPVPSMDEEGLARFKKALADCRCYLEYGCGGSTVYACNVAKVDVVLAVDTALPWVESVKASLEGSGTRLLLQHCDVGEVAGWGRPKDDSMFRNYWQYMVAPWAQAKQDGYIPEVVLVDGRFRVASFLYSLVSAQPGTTILFDDYFGRSHYSTVEEFCDIKERCGRMAVFEAGSRIFSVADITARIAQYSVQAR